MPVPHSGHTHPGVPLLMSPLHSGASLSSDPCHSCAQVPLAHKTSSCFVGPKFPAACVSPSMLPKPSLDSQLEALIVLGGPAVVLGFGCKLAFLVAELWPNDVDFNERPENA